MSEVVYTVEQIRAFAERWEPRRDLEQDAPIIGETRLALMTLQLCDEIARLRELCELLDELLACYRLNRRPRYGLLDAIKSARAAGGEA